MLFRFWFESFSRSFVKVRPKTLRKTTTSIVLVESRSRWFFHSEVVITRDFESRILGSNPSGRRIFCTLSFFSWFTGDVDISIKLTVHCCIEQRAETGAIDRVYIFLRFFFTPRSFPESIE